MKFLNPARAAIPANKAPIVVMEAFVSLPVCGKDSVCFVALWSALVVFVNT